MQVSRGDRSRVAVIGSGISGLSAAWLASKRADVTLFEAEPRLGGHSYTVDAVSGGQSVPVDMGFIVYNEAAYPNLVALFDHLGVKSEPTNMSLGISLDGGRLEYGGGSLSQLIAQKRNVVRPRFWSMVRDIVRFYKTAPAHLGELMGSDMTLRSYLDRYNYGQAFRNDHLLPMAAAIWSVARDEVLEFSAASFIRFHENHGLLKLSDRPLWRTVSGGSRCYVERLVDDAKIHARLGVPVQKVIRHGETVSVVMGVGETQTFDDVVLATHADRALALIDQPTAREARVLGVFRYNQNEVVLHSDAAAMPRRKAVWSSWNYVGDSTGAGVDRLTVTYWMNLLQNLRTARPLFVTLNPDLALSEDMVHHKVTFEHPVMDHRAMMAQRELWSLQGDGGLWFAGAHFGAGFHEDGLQAGLAVAEQMTGARRPWSVSDESGRIVIDNEARRRELSGVAA